MEAFNWDEWNKEMNKLWDRVQEEDADAKDKGELVGRYISEGVADGNAIYQIVSITKTKAKLEHVPLWDAYRVNIIEQMDCKMPLKYVKANIGFRDNLARVFSKS